MIEAIRPDNDRPPPFPAGRPLAMPDGDCILYDAVLDSDRRQRLLRQLLEQTPWEQQLIKIYGREVASPRLSAWHGDPGAVYRYSGLRLEPRAWTPPLLEIKAMAEALAGARFNSVLLNLYRDGRDSMGWHSDAEPELGRNPIIASVSLGARRRFVLRHKRLPVRIELDLEPGGVLIMRGPTQHHWRHQLPKTREPTGPRLNLTFRTIQG